MVTVFAWRGHFYVTLLDKPIIIKIIQVFIVFLCITFDVFSSIHIDRRMQLLAYTLFGRGTSVQGGRPSAHRHARIFGRKHIDAIAFIFWSSVLLLVAIGDSLWRQLFEIILFDQVDDFLESFRVSYGIVMLFDDAFFIMALKIFDQTVAVFRIDNIIFLAVDEKSGDIAVDCFFI